MLLSGKWPQSGAESASNGRIAKHRTVPAGPHPVDSQPTTLDPATGAFVSHAGWAHLMSGRYQEALAAAQRVTQENPSFVNGHYLMVIALAHLDRIDEAKLAAQRLLELAPQFTVSRYQSVSPVKDPEYRRRTAEMFLAAGVPK